MPLSPNYTKKRYAMNRDGSLDGTDVSAHIEGVIRQ